MALKISNQPITDNNITNIIASGYNRGKQISFAPGELLVPLEKLIESMETTNAAGKEKSMIEQLSPDGLAFIAAHYNKKGDQNCNIYVARALNELQYFIQEIYKTSSDKAVVIFQQSEGAGDFKDYLTNFHKMVFYIEKNNNMLHILYADSVDFDDFKIYLKNLFNEFLPPAEFKFYTLKSIKDEENNNIHLQTSWTRCGTHALRIARSIAKQSNFLATLNIKEDTYIIPAEFAKNAESAIARDKITDEIITNKDEKEKLLKFYYKYSGQNYCLKFSQKYINLANAAQEPQIPKQISAGLALNYKQSKPG